MESIYISGKKTKIKNNKINRFVFGKRIVKRDTMYLYFAEKNIVNLNAWVNPERTVNNVGDYLSLVVVNYMCKQFGVSLEERVRKTHHLYSIGSILLGYQDATIWGSGIISDYSSLSKKKLVGMFHRLRHSLDIRAVRGPETLRILKEMGYDRLIKNKCSGGGLPLGDPAVLMPLIYPKVSMHKWKYKVVPHYSRYKSYDKEDRIDTYQSDWRVLIESILEADLIISSSLHGIIIAESYGIPAIMLSDTPMEDITKYKDWYYSTGRYDFPIANSVEEALTITPSKLDPKVLKKMQNELIESFPRDLWK
ncbi:polysaccharide pyruvyl transferase family protein [Ruminococcus difficilis]|uniref:Polysaccharide pyruvyl transferase family protein n=1 Tax=Ruminococcus difficilis TaxID=2763069 RepID=A0A934TYD6_9FIRM|nr:polysaccharide pyruvyl transferase family protein [Ruminococcus difficilis]MBK6087602.1 polysaccharide pyruvyl transferase family protein [Ruminococcus difficilis]